MLKVKFAFGLAAAALLGLLFWKNTKSYGSKTIAWRSTKSLVDFGLIVVTMLRLPALLVAWCVLWICRPIKDPVFRTTVAVFAGLSFGLFGQMWLELLVIAGIFAVDLVTGANGFLGRLVHEQKRDQAKLERAA